MKKKMKIKKNKIFRKVEREYTEEEEKNLTSMKKMLIIEGILIAIILIGLVVSTGLH